MGETVSPAELIPVIQLNNLESLKAAEIHLQKKGFSSKIELLAEMKRSDLQSWMDPKDGEFVFFVEKEKYLEAMKILGSYFGYKG